MTIALAVFDLDGTLIDSRKDLADSANLLLASYGAPALNEDAIVRMVGCGAATLVKRVISAAGVDAPLDEALPRFLSLYDGRLTHHTRPYEGVLGALEELHAAQIAMALLTNKPLQQSLTILRAFELSKFFRWIIGGDGPWPRKPSPEGIQFLMKQASAAPEETILVGDSSVDLETARNAGVHICLARYGFGYADLSAGGLLNGQAGVDSPAQIAAMVYAR